jgi:hypothetical protein
MSALANAAASVTPPQSGKNVYVIPGTASSAAHLVPTACRKAYVVLEADGDTFYVAFGPSTLTVDETDTTTMALVPTLGSECVKIADGESKQFDLNLLADTSTHIVIKGTGTSGYLRITRSSGRV